MTAGAPTDARNTVLGVVQHSMLRLNQPFPESLVGSTDPATLQKLYLLFKVLEYLRSFRRWPQQKRKYSITTTTATQYQLPRDFFSPIVRTHWNQNIDLELQGPLADSDFNIYLHSGISPSNDFAYRIFNWDSNPNSTLGQFEINPTPAAGVVISFDYITRHLLLPPNWLPSTAYTTSNYVNVNGNIYKCSTNGTSSASSPPSTTGTAIVDNTAKWDYYNTPIEAAITDSDIMLFDYELVGLGLEALWKYEQGGGIGSNGRSRFCPTADGDLFDERIQAQLLRLQGPIMGSFGSDNEEEVRVYNIPWKGW